MKSIYTKLDENQLHFARNYLNEQFSIKSWWPKAQPGLAKQEFLLMQGSTIALNIWCEKWLDYGQYRKLEKAIKKKITQ